MKSIEKVMRNNAGHWVGDGFPVRSLFSYNYEAQENSPFLMLDYAGPYDFTPAQTPRGVGQHPHRGFETVTVVYDGEVTHRDSLGHGGTIGPGDVQWMTAASGIFHEEFHSEAFTKKGGRFQMIQLWVNLPAKAKMSQPKYQNITKAMIPDVALPQGAGNLRVIAGQYGTAKGPAVTATPVNMWDLQLAANGQATLDIPEGHTSIVVVLAGEAMVNGTQVLKDAEAVRLSRAGVGVTLASATGAKLLVLTGAPLNEPVVGHGPFVMNTEAEIIQAIDDVRRGRFAA